MLEMILQLLSVVVIILLVLLALSAAVLLLVLFFPVAYRICGSRDGEGILVSVKVKWLLGLFRMQYDYPETGHAVVKVLCFTLFDRKIPSGEDKPRRKKPAGESRAVKDGSDEAESGSGPAVKDGSDEAESGFGPGEDADGGASAAGAGAGVSENPATDGAAASGGDSEGNADGAGASAGIGMSARQEETAGGFDESRNGEGEPPPGKISQKIQKLKYTINGIYDKMKKIWENISYYIGLIREEETKQLFSHIFFRLGRMFRGIRPRHIKAEMVFGTGSPDTTGCLYGLYCMLSGGAGRGVLVIPDFEQAVFRGRLEMAGHITLWVLVFHGARLLFDKKLRRFLKKVKKQSKK